MVYDADGSTLELDVPLDDGKSAQNSRLLARFFDPEVIKMIFSKPETRTRLAQFLENFIAGPEREHCVADMKFLDKVCPSFQILPRDSITDRGSATSILAPSALYRQASSR